MRPAIRCAVVLGALGMVTGGLTRGASAQEATTSTSSTTSTTVPAAVRAELASAYPPPPVPSPQSSSFLGALGTSNSPGWQPALARAEVTGALLLAVLPDSPAEQAGMKAGDVIVGIDGTQIANDEALSTTLAGSAADRRLFTWVSADGATHSGGVRLSRPPAQAVSDYLHRQVTEKGDVLSRALLARGSEDSAVGVEIAKQLNRDLPAFADPYSTLAILTLRDAQFHRDAKGALPADAVAAAEVAIAKATALDPKASWYHTTATQVFLVTGKADRAEAEGRQAVATDPDSAQAQQLFGLALMALGRPAEALPHMHRAVKLDPYSEDYYRSLFDAYNAVGLPDLAQQTRATFDKFQGKVKASKRDVGARRLRVGLAVLVLALLGAGVGSLSGRRARRPSSDLTSALRPDSPRRNWRLGLFEVLVAISVWAVLMPYTGRAFGMAGDSAIREVVALTVPGAVALLTAAWWARRLQAEAAGAPVAVPDRVIGLLFLCGLWMVGTHLKMASQVPTGHAEIDVAVYHVLPGLAIMVLAAWLYVLYGRVEPEASGELAAATDLEPAPTAG